MEPDRRAVDRSRFDSEAAPDLEPGIEPDEPQMAEEDWDALKGAEILGPTEADDGIAGEGVEKDGDLPEEDDDNPDQDSDDALPDDDEEHAIRRDMGGDGVRYEPE